MRKVAMYDLRKHDAYNWDWCLVDEKENDEANCSTSSIGYCDEYGYMVFYDGTEIEAKEYFEDYCEEHNLQLVDYEELEEV